MKRPSKLRKIPVDIIFPRGEGKRALAVNYETGENYIHKEGAWIKSLTKYTGDMHPAEYPRHTGKLSISVPETRLRFKDLPEGSVFRLHDEFSNGTYRQYYKYRFNKNSNAEIFGEDTRVKIDRDALISEDSFAPRRCRP